MPKVGNKHFAYTPDGMEKAKHEAERRGKPLEYRGANLQKTPRQRGVPFHPQNSLVSFTLR